MPELARKLTVTGKIVHGPHRGNPLIDRYFFQLVGVTGCELFKGTLDIKTSRTIDLREFATKTLDRVLLDGSRQVDLYIAPVTLIIGEPQDYIEIEDVPEFRKKDLRERIQDLKKRQEKISAKAGNMEKLAGSKVQLHDCFAVQEGSPMDRTVIEIVDKERLKDKFSLHQNDVVKIIFYERPKKPGKLRLPHVKWKRK